jgi:hypothetical protein
MSVCSHSRYLSRILTSKSSPVTVRNTHTGKTSSGQVRYWTQPEEMEMMNALPGQQERTWSSVHKLNSNVNLSLIGFCYVKGGHCLSARKTVTLSSSLLWDAISIVFIIRIHINGVPKLTGSFTIQKEIKRDLWALAEYFIFRATDCI